MERNEAIEVIKRNYPHVTESGSQFETALRTLIPELKESEDERIRKELLAWLKSRDGQTLPIDRYNAAIAWLEKQGTPAKLSEEEQNKFAKGVLTSCALSFIDYLDAHKYEGKMCVSNGECEDIENAFHNAMWYRLHRYYCKYIEKQGEQKPAEWSEEDDKMLKHIIRDFREFRDYETDEELISDYDDEINWLKSLPKYIQCFDHKK